MWDRVPQVSIYLKEYFEKVWEWFYDRKALPTQKLLTLKAFYRYHAFILFINSLYSE